MAFSARVGSSGCNAMLHRESGVFKTSYAADMALYPLPIARWTVAAIIVLFAVILPATLHEYYLSIINLSLIAIATVAAQLIIEWIINHTPAISGGAQASIQVPRPTLFGHELRTQGQLYFFLLFFAGVAIVATLNLVRGRVGRAFMAIRDQDIAAEIIGINIYRYKLLSFAISSFYAG